MFAATTIQFSKALVRGMILPRPNAQRNADRVDEPIVVAGMFRTGNGLGRAAKSCFEALKAQGANPIAVDLSGLFAQVDLATSVPLQLLPRTQRGTLILCANPPEVERALTGLGLRRWHQWRIVGVWAWELPIAPEEWRRQEKMVSEIWAPSRFVADAFKAQFKKPVYTVPHYVPVPARMTTSLRGGPLHVLTIADARSSLKRKNPVAAVRMFRTAFEGHLSAKLTVKCRNLSLFPDDAARLVSAADGDPRIHFVDKTLTDIEMSTLLETADIILSPHRSEGFGLNLAEALALGKCVIATGWSGNLQFMQNDAARLLPYSLVPVQDPTNAYRFETRAHWAEPDFAAGVKALQELAANPVEREAMGARARQMISNELGTAVYLNTLRGSHEQV